MSVCLGSIFEIKEHTDELKQPKESEDIHLWDVCHCDGDLVVAAYEVHLGKDPLAH